MPRGVYPRRHRTLADRLWAKIDRRGPNECWPWLGYLNPAGYGVIGRRDRGTKLVHRLIYELVHGPLPSHLACCHRCDNPPCCNPAHLFAGTHKVNMMDKQRKGRQVNGSRHGSARLTEDEVAQIRRRYTAGGVLQRELAAEFGVTQSAISLVISGTNWRQST